MRPAPERESGGENEPQECHILDMGRTAHSPPRPLRVLVPVYDIVAYVSTVACTRHSSFGTKEGPRDGR